MLRRAWVLLLACAACGTTNDDRPKTIENSTASILAPTCGAAQCHSTFRQARGDVFDTVAGARRSLVDNGLIIFDSGIQYDPGKPEGAALIRWITETDPFGLGIGRMPYDAPMPNEDVELLRKYIAVGAPGAQCDPAANNGMACNNNDVVKCNADWNFGTKVMTCPTTCTAGVCQ